MPTTNPTGREAVPSPNPLTLVLGVDIINHPTIREWNFYLGKDHERCTGC